MEDFERYLERDNGGEKYHRYKKKKYILTCPRFSSKQISGIFKNLFQEKDKRILGRFSKKRDAEKALEHYKAKNKKGQGHYGVTLEELEEAVIEKIGVKDDIR